MLDEMTSWLGLEPEDTTRLQALVPIVDPHVARIIDRFYNEIERHEGSAAVLEGSAQVQRLKASLRQWLTEVFVGPHDAAYAQRRMRIGHMHVKVGLPDRYMYLAMAVIREELTAVIYDGAQDPKQAMTSLNKVLTLDLALMTGTYVQGREAKQLDVLQSLLVQHLRLVVFLIDRDGIVRSATEASARLAGLPDATGQHWRTVLPDPLIASAKLDTLLSDDQHEVTLPRVDVADGTTVRSFRIQIVPLAHDMASTLLQIEELTDAVQMEARLRQNESLAQLGALSAAVSHELRNPLAGISGALQVIHNGLPEDAPYRPILTKVDAEVRRLNGLVGELLAFAKPRSAVNRVVDLRDLATEVVGLIQGDHPALRFEVDGTGTAFADPDLIRQILHNLLRNAADAATHTITTQVSPGQLVVRDDGPGVPDSVRDTLFKPFVTTKTRGTGLGLAISARNAQAMDGRLRLLDGPGGVFCLALQEAVGD